MINYKMFIFGTLQYLFVQSSLEIAMAYESVRRSCYALSLSILSLYLREREVDMRVVHVPDEPEPVVLQQTCNQLLHQDTDIWQIISQ